METKPKHTGARMKSQLKYTSNNKCILEAESGITQGPMTLGDQIKTLKPGLAHIKCRGK